MRCALMNQQVSDQQDRLLAPLAFNFLGASCGAAEVRGWFEFCSLTYYALIIMRKVVLCADYYYLYRVIIHTCDGSGSKEHCNL